jgi:hypothetical protein
VLACKWKSDFFVGLALRQISHNAELPLYIIDRKAVYDVNPSQIDKNIPKGLFLIPDTDTYDLSKDVWPNKHVRRSLEGSFWKTLSQRSPKLQWTDIYIKYEHNNDITYTDISKPLFYVELAPWAIDNLRLFGFELDFQRKKVNVNLITGGTSRNHFKEYPLLESFSWSFTRQGAQWSREGFRIWVEHRRRSRGYRAEKAFWTAYVQIPSSDSPPPKEAFSEVETWDGLTRVFGDAERAVRLSFIPRKGGSSVESDHYELLIDLEGSAYWNLGHSYE